MQPTRSMVQDSGALQKVLVVDDQHNIRRLLGITLGRHFHVLEAADGASALQLIQAHQPRVVLLDVMMPGEPDGLGVLDRIKASPATRHIQVGMLTARGQVADQADARARGADTYFTKPFSPNAVLSWVASVLLPAAPGSDSLPG